MAGIIVLLLFPISHINGLINERQKLQASVIADIAQRSSRSQIIAGPIIIQPYVKTEKVWRRNKNSGDKYEEDVKTRGEIVILPDNLELKSKLTNETRRRGIYTAQLYHADTEIKGHIKVAKDFGLSNIEQYEFFDAFVIVSTSDMRGFESTVNLSIADQRYEFMPGTGHQAFSEGIHAMLPAFDISKNKTYDFEIAFTLQGTEKLAFIPIGKESTLHMQSDWPHPSFQGNYLPVEYNINNEGFSAKWRASYFSTNLGNVVNGCVKVGNCNALEKKSFRVDLFSPVNVYVKSHRAIKYALLFIVLTFTSFFLFELLKSLKVHPVQYILVGVALALFYLLLMSLAEHFAFAFAYLVASITCVSLISFYMGHTLGSFKRALGFGLALGLLYGMLYGLLSSEDYSMLLGTILIFSILSVFMALTRKLDWYEIGNYLTAGDKPSNPKQEI